MPLTDFLFLFFTLSAFQGSHSEHLGEEILNLRNTLLQVLKCYKLFNSILYSNNRVEHVAKFVALDFRLSWRESA